ncbi:MAG: RnfABCDGE type electron transport complex subunit D [Chloroflexota bacterium]
MAPSVVMGLVFFKVAALIILALALLIGALAHLAARLAKLPVGVSPILAAVIGVALVGPATPLQWVAVIAALGAVLELARARWLPQVRAHTGLLAYAAVFLATQSATAAYLNPGGLQPLAEPIRFWAQYADSAGSAFDPVRLYVGNVPGPVFASSLMAVVAGAAWLWYAGRLSPAVVVAFLAGAIVPIALLRWNPAFQLESGPAFFVVLLLLADRRYLPTSNASRPLIGVAAGVAGVALRSRGLGVEAMFLVVAALQAAVATVEGGEWLVVHRARMVGRLRGVGRDASVRLPRRRPA